MTVFTKAKGGADVASTVLFKNKQSNRKLVVRKLRKNGANDNYRVLEFDGVDQQRDWCSIAVFTSLMFAGTLLLLGPFM
jgi:hypothetical protein